MSATPGFVPWLAVFIGGGLGSLLRYACSGAVYRVMGQDFPYGTLAVNVAGSLLLGALMELANARMLLPPPWRIFLTIGLCGGFTTFSTFAYETVALASAGSWALAALNASGSLLLCLGGIWAGTVLVRLI
jgi:fluoride exporter